MCLQCSDEKNETLLCGIDSYRSIGRNGTLTTIVRIVMHTSMHEYIYTRVCHVSFHYPASSSYISEHAGFV